MKTNETENFIKITTSLRKRKDLSPTHKYVLSYLLSFQQNGKACFQTQEEIAEELGMTTITLKRAILSLEEAGHIIKEKASKWSGKPQYKNRKALIAHLNAEDTSDIKPVLETIQDTKENIQEAKEIAKEDMKDDFWETLYDSNDFTNDDDLKGVLATEETSTDEVTIETTNGDSKQLRDNKRIVSQLLDKYNVTEGRESYIALAKENCNMKDICNWIINDIKQSV